jgi:nucleoside permease NupC
MTDVLRGLLGLTVLVSIGIALSENRSAIRPRVVLSRHYPRSCRLHA